MKGIDYNRPKIGGGGGGQDQPPPMAPAPGAPRIPGTPGGGNPFGRGGPGGGPNPPAAPQADAFQMPPIQPINVETPIDPGQQEARDAWAKYNRDLEAGTAAETERELQRYRDELSVGLQSEGNAALSRGADPSLFQSRALESGKRGLIALQGNLADVSLGKRAEALGGWSSAANAAATARNSLHLGTLAAMQDAQRTYLQGADLQARLREAPYDRLMRLMGMMGSNADVFSGLTGSAGGGGYGTGGVNLGGGGLRPRQLGT